MMPIVGQSASLSKTITWEDIQDFARLTGDTNPLHFDEEFAIKTRFGQRVAHGMLIAALISAVIGTQLPGPGTIYINQMLQFVAPVFIGDTITATVIVVKVREDKPVVTLETICTNQHGQVVLRGEAVVLAHS
jgi:3-hydroxybutyryl-CoA dehydratase